MLRCCDIESFANVEVRVRGVNTMEDATIKRQRGASTLHVYLSNIYTVNLENKLIQDQIAFERLYFNTINSSNST